MESFLIVSSSCCFHVEIQSVNSVTLTVPVPVLLPSTAIFCPGEHLMYSTHCTGMSALVDVAVGLSPTTMRTPSMVALTMPAAHTLIA